MIKMPLVNSVRVTSGLALLLLFLLPSDGLPLEICLSQIITEVPCPFCGMTRSLSSFLHFEWSKSFAYHPLGMLIGICLLLVFVSGRLPGGDGAGKPGQFIQTYYYALLISAGTLFFVVWLIRLIWFDFPF